METVEAGSVAPSITSSGIQSEAGERNSQGSLLQKRGPLESIAIFVMRQSYVGTLIIMMAWSITYHSWLTFVFLLWACIIWLIPQKRDVCLRCSPLIVLYAVCLLVICYVYGFNLTDAELPVQSENGYKFREIGLIKYDHQCIQLAVQVLFTVMFWVTLRQAVQEWMQRRQSAMGQGLALEVVGAPPPENEDPFRVQHRMPSNAKDGLVGHDSDAIKSVGRWMWHMFCKYWIFVCTGMFLLIALQEAVIYRIIYMVLFLYFVITFQICYRWWRLSISVFWWVVIIYSMIVLCVLYTYQFDEIPWGWVNRTSISKEVLSDIGLEKFDTGTLFVKLLTPTSFLIVIIIQLHYFQRPFLTLSDINRFRGPRPKRKWFWQKSSREETTELNVEDEDEANRIHSNVSAQSDDPIAGPSHDEVTQETDLETSTQVTSISPRKQRRRGWRDRFARAFSHAWNTMYNMLDAISALLWRFMEVHIVKIVMLTVIIVSMSEVCALNVLFVVFVVVGVVSPSLFALMSHLCQCWSAVVILCKMTYQLNVISSEDVLTNCTHVSNAPFSNATHDQLPYPFNGTIDNANYIGLEKAPNLAEYLRNYIFVVVIIGLEAVVKVHQMQYWNHIDHSKPKHGIVFPETKRADADTGLLPCAKFFMNYTFYKFGLQICFIMTMITMVVRLDVYSVLYGIMLGVLLLLNRRTSYVVWPVYMVVLMVLLVLQYLSCLGVPPGLCWVYPWDNISNFTRNLKIYLYLPNYLDPPNPYKLIADFFQLLFVCLQWWVFRLENSPSQAEAYGGGSNKDIVRDVEENKPNPVEDFLSYKDSYLDYLKAGLFQYSFWVTLVIVFIAGTARISLFCLGYLVGCFFFFWFGQDLLLKPLPNLLRLWGILLGYNYFVILAKACLQMVGCVYLNDLIGGSYCWVVQLFSIVCLRSGNYIPTSSGSTCRLDEDEAGLTWDAICFVFLLIMLRVFKSWYFQHVVMELYVENKLASRGAELINTNLIKRVAEMKSRERDTLASIKRKMERIRLRQARLQSKAIKESEDHYIGQ